MHRMKINSKISTKKGAPLPCSATLLHNSLQKTALCFSLDHCFHPEKPIDKVISGQDCDLKRRLAEVAFEKQEEQLEVYYKQGQKEMGELTQYYKYYTQTSINYQPGFYRVMHNYREQRKAVQYNRLKFILDLSNSTHTNSPKTPRLENSLAQSFRLLSLLKITNNEESILLEKLKQKLQKDYGPSCFSSVEELDKQYCFSKTVDLKVSQDKANARRPSKKVSKNMVEKQSSLFRSKINNYTRNNSCGQTIQQSYRKDESKGKIKRKKYGSMDNLHSLGQKEPKEGRESKLVTKENRETKQNEIKRKIIGMKEQIRREKELLIKRTESTRSKKVGVGLAKRVRN